MRFIWNIWVKGKVLRGKREDVTDSTQIRFQDLNLKTLTQNGIQMQEKAPQENSQSRIIKFLISDNLKKPLNR
jgi:hypothetical protein